MRCRTASMVAKNAAPVTCNVVGVNTEMISAPVLMIHSIDHDAHLSPLEDQLEILKVKQNF